MIAAWRTHFEKNADGVQHRKKFRSSQKEMLNFKIHVVTNCMHRNQCGHRDKAKAYSYLSN